jgi:hypothetical protein
LTLACRLGYCNLADILIDAGADMNFETTRGTWVPVPSPAHPVTPTPHKGMVVDEFTHMQKR